MIRSAEEIMQAQFAFYTNLVSGEKRTIISAINEARIEAIKECAEVGNEVECTRVENGFTKLSLVPNKEILKLIDQIK